jgi:integrase
MESRESTSTARSPWKKGKIVGQKTPFKLKEIWAIRVRLQLTNRCRELALFNLAIESKLRACDLVKLRVRDICHGQTVAKNLRAVQLLLGHTKLESTVRYLGIEVNDALEMAEQTEV